MPELVVDRDVARTKLFENYIVTPPRDRQELHWWIREYLHFDVPNRKVCDHHDAPFEFIAIQFFEEVQTVFGFANRSGAKTRDTAILNICDGFFKRLIEILCAGAVKDQADRGYEYVREMLVNEKLLYDKTLVLTKGETRFYNHSTIKLTVATWAGLNGPHPCKVRIDELELLHPNVLAEGLSMSQAKTLPDGTTYRAQDTFTSTRKVPSGTVQRMLDQAEEKGIRVISWCIWETLEKCTRQCKNDPKYGNCPAYARTNKDNELIGLCGLDVDNPSIPPHGKAQDLPLGGFYKIDDFVKKVGVLDRETFETQWLNLRPSGGALVYGDYFKAEAPFVVKSPEKDELLRRMSEEKWARVVGLDFGANFAVEYCAYDKTTDIWYVYHEKYWFPEQDMPMIDRAKVITATDPAGWTNRLMLFCDPAGKQAITDLQNFGVQALPANNDLYAGVQYLKLLFQSRFEPSGRKLPKLRIFDDCKRLIKELSQLYLHPQDKGGEINRDKFLKRDDHGPDALRYGLFSYATIGTSSYKMKSLRGVA